MALMAGIFTNQMASMFSMGCQFSSSGAAGPGAYDFMDWASKSLFQYVSDLVSGLIKLMASMLNCAGGISSERVYNTSLPLIEV
jgi:hypothetical protein